MSVRPIMILVPVLNRPENVAPFLESYRAYAKAHAHLQFIVNADDWRERHALDPAFCEANDFSFTISGSIMTQVGVSWAKKINTGYEMDDTESPYILLGADDIRFTPGWYEHVRPYIEDGFSGVIGTNDGGNPATASGETSTHPIVAASYIDELGTWNRPGEVVHPGYHHNFPDTELSLTAKQRGRWVHVPECIIEHLHPAWGKAVDDEVYALGRSRYEEDELEFTRRVLKYGGDR